MKISNRQVTWFVLVLLSLLFAIPASAQMNLEIWEEFLRGSSNATEIADDVWRLDYSFNVPSSGNYGWWRPHAWALDKPWFFSVTSVEVRVEPWSKGWKAISGGVYDIGEWMTGSLVENSDELILVAVANQKHDSGRTVSVRITGRRDGEAIR